MLLAREGERMASPAMISRCPQCGYSLQGLPEEHQCPECGFAYDAHTVVLDFLPAGSYGWKLAQMAAWLVVAWFFWRPAGIASQMMWMVLPITFVAAVWRYSFLAAARRDGWRCVLRRSGLMIQRPRRPAWGASWAEFDHARLGRLTGHVRIWNEQGRIVFNAPYRHFGSYKNAKRCANEMNRLAKVYTGEPGESAAR